MPGAIAHSVDTVERWCEAAAAKRRRRDRVHRARLLLPRDPRRCGGCRTSWSAASTRSSPTSRPSSRQGARPAGQARTRGRLRAGPRGRDARAARPVPLGLLARLGALRGRPCDRLRAQPRSRRSAPEAAYGRYTETLAAAAGSGLFDSLSHPDLIKFHGGAPRLGLVAGARRDGRHSLEVSTAGYYKPHGRIYPEPELLRAARERGVTITLASDAHEPANVGRDLDRGIEHARAAGYETLTVFDRRAPPGAARVSYRVGTGFDAHALEDGVPLVLGGVEIDFPSGLAGHSDGDVIVHALIDAVLGAAGLDDIGAMFPSGDERWRGASSLDLLRDAWAQVRAGGLRARERRLRADRRAAAAGSAPREDARPDRGGARRRAVARRRARHDDGRARLPRTRRGACRPGRGPARTGLITSQYDVRLRGCGAMPSGGSDGVAPAPG